MSKAFKIYGDRLKNLLCPDSRLQKLTDGAIHGEGPVYFYEDDSVIWSDAHDNRLLRWNPTEGNQVIREPSHYQSGNYRDLQGRLVSCSQGQRAIIRREDDGEWRVLVDRYQGKRLNSPNDLVVKSDGTIWFSDPTFGLTHENQGYGGEQEQAGDFVYRFDPKTGEIDAIIKEMAKPNGLAFSPDESLLYVSDTSAVEHPQQHHYIRVYQVVENRYVKEGKVFANIEPGEPDGFRVDIHGNIFTSSADSVQVYAPDGTRLGKIFVPELCTNLTFGGKDKNILFITAKTSLYAIALNTKGVQQP
ncbi:MAG: SMP-30/gluconolactonase/LRE family protein [Pleurocapsa sp.]